MSECRTRRTTGNGESSACYVGVSTQGSEWKRDNTKPVERVLRRPYELRLFRPEVLQQILACSSEMMRPWRHAQVLCQAQHGRAVVGAIQGCMSINRWCCWFADDSRSRRFQSPHLTSPSLIHHSSSPQLGSAQVLPVELNVPRDPVASARCAAHHAPLEGTREAPPPISPIGAPPAAPLRGPTPSRRHPAVSPSTRLRRRVNKKGRGWANQQRRQSTCASDRFPS